MGRKVRYPFSPLQEIFLKAEEPFVLYDQTSPSAPSPPLAATSSSYFGDDFSRCLQLKNLHNEAERQLRKGNASELDFVTALRQHRRCVNFFQGRLLRSYDEDYLSFRRALDSRAVVFASGAAASAVAAPAVPLSATATDDARKNDVEKEQNRFEPIFLPILLSFLFLLLLSLLL